MAKTCFLCGGPLKDGRCTECGLDNNKNDKKYQLNTHNDAGAHFHSGDCEDQLNRERKEAKQDKAKKKKQEKQQPETFDYQEMLEQEKKKVHSGSTKQSKNGKKTETASGRRKKKHGVFWWIVIIYILIGLIGSVMENSTGSLEELQDLWEELTDSFHSAVDDDPEEAYEADEYDQEQFYGADEEDGSDLDQDSEEPPEKIAYDQTSGRYFTTELEQGIYTVGYEIPAGTYQFQIEDEEYATTLITWYHQEISDPIYLCSETVRAEYWENQQEECPFSEYSPELVLQDGEQLYIENNSAGILKMSGLKEERVVLKKHAAQTGLQEVLVDSADGNVSLICGESFAPGVYDLVAEGEFPYAFVNLSSEHEIIAGGYEEYGIGLEPEHPVCRRLPLEEGTEVLVEYLAEDGQLRLVPSY